MGESENINLKEMLKEREKAYMEATGEMVAHFFLPLKQAVEEHIYNGNETKLVIQNLVPVPINLNYVSLILRAASYKVGDNISIHGDESKKTLEVTGENFWEFADTITMNVPITVLESADEATIYAYLEQMEIGDDTDDEEMQIPVDLDDADGDELGLDDAQKSLLSLYNSKSDSKH